MRNFFRIWLGQLISVFGSGMTRFAVGVWVYQQTGSATQMAMISVCGMLPVVVLSPLAGSLVDRWDRRKTLIATHIGAGLSIMALAVLFWLDALAVWQIYLAIIINGICNAFSGPAVNASVPLLVPKEQLGRASGLMQLPQAAEFILSPVAAGFLITLIHLHGIFLLDVVTFCFAIMMLLLSPIPRPQASAQAVAQTSLLQDMAYGWHYLVARPGLLGLLLLWGCAGLVLGIISVLVTPLVLAFASTAVLGVVMSIAGSGMLIGSVVMGVWGGPRRRIYGIFGFMLLEGIGIFFCGVQPSPVIFTIAAFTFFFSFPIVNGCTQAILQSKVEPAVQGRVFAFSNTIAWATLPLGYMLAGPLADQVFEPLLLPGGPLAESVGQIIGVGVGRGIGLLFITAGLLYLVVALGGYLHPRIRGVERELPDTFAEAKSDAQQPTVGDQGYATAS